MEIPGASGDFKGYLILWSILTLISLGFDVVDVWKHFANEEST